MPRKGEERMGRERNWESIEGLPQNDVCILGTMSPPEYQIVSLEALTPGITGKSPLSDQTSIHTPLSARIDLLVGWLSENLILSTTGEHPTHLKRKNKTLAK